MSHFAQKNNSTILGTRITYQDNCLLGLIASYLQNTKTYTLNL